MGIEFARESVRGVRGEIEPLLQLHKDEIAHYSDIELDPDWDFYLQSPAVRVYTVRRVGLLIGYGVFFVGPNRHYRKSIQAVQDILFLHPAYRGGRTGYRLLQFCENQAKAEGAQVIYHHVKKAHDFSPLLGHMGYELIDGIYGKRLDKE